MGLNHKLYLLGKSVAGHDLWRWTALVLKTAIITIVSYHAEEFD